MARDLNYQFLMRHLSDLDSAERLQKLSELKSVVEAYSNWIDALSEKKKDLPSYYLLTNSCRLGMNILLG